MSIFRSTRRNPTTGERKDLRLMTGRFNKFYALLAAAVLAGCGVFFVCTARTVTYVEGPCYNYGIYMFLFVPANQCENVHVGDSVWVGNERGRVVSLEKGYWDYQRMYDEFGEDPAEFGIDTSATYCVYYAQVPDAANGEGRFRIITGEKGLSDPGKE